MRDLVADFLHSTDTFNCLMSAIILFVIIMQRQGAISKRLTLIMEVVKSSCATAVWIWLVLDSAFGPHNGYGDTPKGPRIIRSIISCVTLL
jgi:hypothetical protein